MAAATTKNKGGRPELYRDELADVICERITLGESLRKITRDKKMPSISTVMKWRRENEEFSKQYARAKEEQAETFEEMMLEIAKSEEDVARARLIVDTMKWTSSKLKPKKYGNQIDVTSDGKALPTPIIALSDTTDDINSAT